MKDIKTYLVDFLLTDANFLENIVILKFFILYVIYTIVIMYAEILKYTLQYFGNNVNISSKQLMPIIFAFIFTINSRWLASVTLFHHNSAYFID